MSPKHAASGRLSTPVDRPLGPAVALRYLSHGVDQVGLVAHRHAPRREPKQMSGVPRCSVTCALCITLAGRAGDGLALLGAGERACRVHPDGQAELRIIHRDPAQLHPNPRNPRTHTPRPRSTRSPPASASSAFVTPVLVDASGMIVAGHGRVAAARRLGLTSIPTVQVDHLSAAELRAFVIADNKIALNAGWDEALLRVELEELSVMELDFSVEITGFSTGEIDVLIGEPAAEPDPADAVPTVDPGAPAVTRPGDLWQLGPHRILCGDARDAGAYARLLGQRAGPAGRRRRALQRADRRARHRQGPDPPCRVRHGRRRDDAPPAFTAFLRQALMQQMAAYSVDGAVHFHLHGLASHRASCSPPARASTASCSTCASGPRPTPGWARSTAASTSWCSCSRSAPGAHINNVQLGVARAQPQQRLELPRRRTASGPSGSEALAWHPTVKPVRLVADAILDASKRGGLVLDPLRRLGHQPDRRRADRAAGTADRAGADAMSMSPSGAGSS